HPARSLWSGRHLAWHINCLEMLAVFRALKHFLLDLIGHHVLVRTDNTAVVYYINHQRGLRSRPLYKLAHQILVWSQDKLLSLRAVHVPGHLNMGADILSRQGLRPGEWMLHPKVVKQIWRVFGQAQVDFFATQENAQCPHWYSLTHLGLDAMVQTWPRLYAFPPITLLPGVLERVCRDGVRLLLVAPYWLAQAWFSDLISLLDGSPCPGYIPKVPSAAPRPVVLQAFCLPPFRDPDQQKLSCIYPVRTLDTYVSRAALWRKTDQLFVCYGPPKRGLPASKHTLSRWIVDAITQAYEFSDLPSPLGVKAHSTRGISASKAFISGVPMQDICDAAGWSTPLCQSLLALLSFRPSTHTGQGLGTMGAVCRRSSSYDCNPGSPKGTRRCVSGHTSCIPANVCFLLKLNAGSGAHALKLPGPALPKAFVDAASRSLRGTGVTVRT
ncbi:hypothetical protein M9458_049675, partial [Cirrhinus mrigala]